MRRAECFLLLRRRCTELFGLLPGGIVCLRPAGLIFSCKSQQIRLQNILVDDPYVIVLLQSLLQDRDQLPVDLYGGYALRCFAQILSQRPDAGADLEDNVIFINLRSLKRAQDHSLIHKKVLSEALAEVKVML